MIYQLRKQDAPEQIPIQVIISAIPSLATFVQATIKNVRKNRAERLAVPESFTSEGVYYGYCLYRAQDGLWYAGYMSEDKKFINKTKGCKSKLGAMKKLYKNLTNG